MKCVAQMPKPVDSAETVSHNTAVLPDERVTWRATSGAKNDGTVSFGAIGPDRTQVTMRLDFEPEGFAEKAADVLHLVDLQVDRDLHKFKDFIEQRQAETGAWRGSIKPTGDVDPGPEQTP